MRLPENYRGNFNSTVFLIEEKRNIVQHLRWQRTAIVQKLTTFVKNVCCALLVRDAFHLDEHGWCYIKSVPNESGWLDLHLRCITHNVPKSCSTLFITLTNFWAICMADKTDKVVGCIFFHFEMRRGLIR